MGDHNGFEDNQYPDNDDFVLYVTAGILPQKNGANIALWGRITRVSGSTELYVKTVDEQEVLIRLKKPGNERLEGWYEFYGVSQGKSILCEEYVPFSEDMAKNIDIEGHKALARFLAALDDPWNIGEDSSTDMAGVESMD